MIDEEKKEKKERKKGVVPNVPLPPDVPRFLNVEMFAAQLGCSVQAVYDRLARERAKPEGERRIPRHYKIGRRLVFEPDACWTWLTPSDESG